MIGGQLDRQGSSYRSGLVLGLTMAEVMLLLVFCLLIASAVALGVEQKRRAAAETRLLQLVSVDDSKEKLANDLGEERDRREHAEQEARRTRESAQAYQTLLDELKRHPPLSELAEKTAHPSGDKPVDEDWRTLVESAAIVQQLSRAGVDLSNVKRDAEAFAAVQRLQKESVDIKRLVESAKFGEAIKQLLAQNNVGPKSPREIIDLILIGLSTNPNVANGGHKWPPIINLSETDGYYFQVGSAALSDEFRLALTRKVVPKILEIANEYSDVDVIEIVGHTDEQAIRRRFSNMDEDILSVLRSGDVSPLVPADNAGLGLARAVAIVTTLRDDPRLRRFPRILPLSGAQLIQIDEMLTHGAEGNVKERRRIEIRLRKHQQPTGTK